MKFDELLIGAIQQSEIPLRFEPGAEEAVAKPVIEILKTWVTLHLPDDPVSDYDRGYQALALQLLSELDGSTDLPA